MKSARQRKATPQACKEAEITVQTSYRGRKKYGGLKMDGAKRLKELEKESGKLKPLVAEPALDKEMLKDIAEGKLLSRKRRRCAVEHARERHEVSERQVGRVVRHWRGTQRYVRLRRMEEDELTKAILDLANLRGRF